MKTLAVANQKGGVGKSTLTVHLAHAALEAGLRVLLVDMDKQGSLSLSFPPADGAQPGLLAAALYGPETPEQKPEYISENLAIIRADDALLAVDREGDEVLRLPGAALRHHSFDFDLCLIDTPPLMGVRLTASLAAAQFVVTPVSVGLYELAGLGALIETIDAIRTKGLNPRLRHIGILPMKTNSRSTDERESVAGLRVKHGDRVFAEELPERAPVRAAIANHRPVWTGTKGEGHLKAAQEWRAACASILSRIA